MLNESVLADAMEIEAITKRSKGNVKRMGVGCNLHLRVGEIMRILAPRRL
jgi:hypothetical protein